MRPGGITCADSEERDLDARYASGQLAEAEAEAFEEHFFGCDHCWTRVQRAVEIRAVEGEAARTATPIHASARSNFAPSRWMALAAAATLLIVGTLSTDAWRRPGMEPVAMRGATDSLNVVTSIRGTSLVAAWKPASEASSYRARLYSADGKVLYQRETADTTVAVAAASLRHTTPGAMLYWEIQALNRTRQVVARSGLRPLRFPGAALP